MPAALRLTTMEELKNFEVYLAAVAEEKTSALDIPLKFAPLATVEERAPELVGRRYRIYYSETSKNALQSNVSVKEMIQWQCIPENWQTLQCQFPDLARETDSPFEILEKLEDRTRKLVDTFSRKKIVELHPEWVSETLCASEMKEKELFISPNSEKLFDGIVDCKKFAADLESQGELVGYTQDENHYYRFLVKERKAEKEILNYKEAAREKILEKIAEKMKGDALVQAVVEAMPQKYKKEAPIYRFADFIKKYKDSLPEQDLAKQFPIEKKEKTITRNDQNFISIEEALALSKGACSEIKANPKEGAYLYKFIEKRMDTSLPLEKLLKSQELLSKEARCRYFETLLSQMKTDA